MLAGLAAEASSAFVVEREGDEVPFRRIVPRLRVGEVFAGDDRARVDEIERRVAMCSPRSHRRSPSAAPCRAAARPALPCDRDSSAASARRTWRRDTRRASVPAESASRTGRPSPSRPSCRSCVLSFFAFPLSAAEKRFERRCGLRGVLPGCRRDDCGAGLLHHAHRDARAPCRRPASCR